ncbi:epithelial chloride channel -like protein [Labeo rohita]|uniref:Epithelial chloride channel-like protein n=1 Tax=Labeo rohita TaxID=84645 RepID=A0A498P1H3_LABRO|nr:epithelial chloride channel -like protein [Labeo rohita]
MDSRTVFVLLWMLLSSTSTDIKLDGNGYVDIIIAISSRVPEDDRLIDKIKEMVTEGSIYLYEALDKKVYFKEATILVPPHWNTTKVTNARTESFDKAKIRIDNPAQGDEPYTKQYDGCGKEGQYIHFTPNYLLNDTVIQLYGLKGKVFVHEWAHLRWGVFDETNDKEPFYISNRRVEATRCSKDIKGQLHEVTAGGSLQRCSMDPQTSLPTEKCKFFPNKNQNTNSSLMFLSSLDSGPRILQQRQAATHFLRKIIEDQARVGIVTFSSSASTLSPLITIDSDTTRENLIKLLPTVATGSTLVCSGLSRGLQELGKDGDVSGGELIFLTDGMATDNVASCAPSAIQSGAIIHTLAFGNSADPALTEMANKTGEVQLNPPKPPVSDEPLEVGSFTRTATGESFVVTLSGPPPNFPPNRITDLSAEIQEDTVLLSWTAPGEDLDEGTASTGLIVTWVTLQFLMNHLKLEASPEQPQNRTARESFVVTLLGPSPNFPPNRITDLREITGAEAEPHPPEILDQPSVYTVHEILDSRRRRGASGAAPGGGGNVRVLPQSPTQTTPPEDPPNRSRSPDY